MKKYLIGDNMRAIITQRQRKDDYGCSIDVLEGAYVEYFENIGVYLTIVSNFTKHVKEMLEEKIDFIILTGGGDISSKYYRFGLEDFSQKKRDDIEIYLINHSIKNNIPILGICRGMQLLNVYKGGSISKLNNLNVKRYIGQEHPVYFDCNKKIYVNNYHNYGIYIDDLSTNFDLLCIDSENDIVEGFYDESLKWLGVQFHPERTMKDSNSRIYIDCMIRQFFKEGGVIDESYYFSSRSRN